MDCIWRATPCHMQSMLFAYDILRTRLSSGNWEKTMDMKRFTRPFRQLRGKLTLSYTLTSVVTFLLIELIFIVVVFSFVSLNVPGIVLNSLKQEAPQAAPYFVYGSPDREELTAWLQIISPTVSNQGPFKNPPIILAVVDTRGQTVASIGSHPVPANTPISF